MKLLKISLALLLSFTLLSCNKVNAIDLPAPDQQKDEPKPSEEPDKKDESAISIIAIGNSFSQDATQYIYQILQQLGYKTIKLGNLYIGGCTLQTHASNLNNNTAAYTYYTNYTGDWTSQSNFRAETALKSEKWDYVVMQQASGVSGVENSFEPYLSTAVETVKSLCPDAKLLWHMTWAYQQNSTHKEFPNYNSDQMTMYNAIVSCVKNKVQPKNVFSMVIPCGTAVQNLRTSFIGDTVTRDGYHMSYDLGRFLTGLMWVKQITACDLSKITYTPESYMYTDDQLKAIFESVENAYSKPFEVTQSQYKGSTEPEPDDKLNENTTDKMMTAKGYDLSKYEKTALTITENAYYQSNNATYYKDFHLITSASNSTQFAATQIFEKKDIPNGSVIVVASGYQYRPEGWVAADVKNTSGQRPANVTAPFTVVDDKWWLSNDKTVTLNYRGFNLAESGNPALDAERQALLKYSFAIYRPKN